MSEYIATRAAYGDALAELGRTRADVVVFDADLSGATCTNKFAKEFPERFFNAGIAEANMADMAAGMSLLGYTPFCSTFAVFGTGRIYDQIRNGISYAGLNVKLCMTHAGVSVGEDGGTHQAIEDIALMRAIPGMTVIAPADANETRAAVFAAAEMKGPVYIRLARAQSVVFEGNLQKPFVVGKANVLKDDGDVAIFSYGFMVPECLKAAELLGADGIRASVINMHTIKPLDEECVRKYAEKCKKIVTVEDHSTIGGLGEAVASVIAEAALPCRLIKLGVQDRFGQSGKPDAVLQEYELTAAQIAEKIKNS